MATTSPDSPEASEVCAGCQREASTKLACPKCLQSGVHIYFCSQDCFKSNYSRHKSLHKNTVVATKNGTTAATAHRRTPPRDGITCDPTTSPLEVRTQLPVWAERYAFTGPLRPCLLSPRRTVPDRVRHPDYAHHPSGVSDCEQRDRSSHTQLRVFTEAADLKAVDDPTGLRHAGAMGREVLNEAARALRVGVTTDELDRVVHEACIERNVYPSPLNYYNFPKSVCTSVNEVICHGIPDFREVQDGDIVNLDVTVYNAGGYHGDLNETFCVGNVDADGRRLVETSFQCLANALQLVKPGTLYRDLGAVIEKTAKQNHCSVVRTYCGHGIGSLFHTLPNVPHYSKNKAKGVMKVGHVFTVEPMINLGSPADKTWGDNWTAVTTDGMRSSQFEHTLVVTETGYELLTGRENEPVMLWNAALNQR